MFGAARRRSGGGLRKSLERMEAKSATEACDGADVIVTATFAKDPVIPSEAVKEDALILAMGANAANRREIPEDLVRRARIVVDDIEQCRIEAGDLLLAGMDWTQVETVAALVANNVKAGEDHGSRFSNLSG